MLVLYLAPWVVARMRGHRSSGAILVLNLIFGWTFLGWVISLIWALTGNVDENLASVPLIFYFFLGIVGLIVAVLIAASLFNL